MFGFKSKKNKCKHDYIMYVVTNEYGYTLHDYIKTFNFKCKNCGNEYQISIFNIIEMSTKISKTLLADAVMGIKHNNHEDYGLYIEYRDYGCCCIERKGELAYRLIQYLYKLDEEYDLENKHISIKEK